VAKSIAGDRENSGLDYDGSIHSETTMTEEENETWLLNMGGGIIEKKAEQGSGESHE